MVKVCHFRKNNEILHCLFCFSFTLFPIPSPPHRYSLQKNSRQNANDAFFQSLQVSLPKRTPIWVAISVCMGQPFVPGLPQRNFLQGVSLGGKMATLGVFFHQENQLCMYFQQSEEAHTLRVPVEQRLIVSLQSFAPGLCVGRSPDYRFLLVQGRQGDTSVTCILFGFASMPNTFL